MRRDRTTKQLRQTLERHVVIGNVHTFRKNITDIRSNTGFFRNDTLIVASIPRTSAAVGISLALIWEAQSPWRRVEEHFLVNSSKLSKMFLLSSSCRSCLKHFIHPVTFWEQHCDRKCPAGRWYSRFVEPFLYIF